MALKDEYMTITQVAEELGVTRQTISRWVAEGKFHAEKVGRQKFIAKKLINSFKLFLAQRLAEILIMELDAFIGHEGSNIHIEGDMVSDRSFRAFVSDKEGKVEFVEITRKATERKGRAGSDFRFRRVDKLPDSPSKYEPFVEIYYGVNKQGKVVAAGMKHLPRMLVKIKHDKKR